MTEQTRYRALDMLTRQYAPKRAHRDPFWRPERPEPTERVWVPAWSWRVPASRFKDAPPPEQVAILDANGAYLSAIATVEVAHGALHRTRSLPFDPRRPGYWLTTRHPWPMADKIMSPLGEGGHGRKAGTVWLTTPTMQLLAQLVEQGKWPDVEVLDSWTADDSCRLRTWAQRIQTDRLRAIDHHDDDREDEIKLAYSQAVTLMFTGEGSKVDRPDWAYSIRAQHSASGWRKAWRGLDAGYHIMGAGSVDELVYDRVAAQHLWKIRQRTPAPPIRIDLDRRELGTFKVKATVPFREWVA